MFALKKLELVLILRPQKLNGDVELASVPHASGTRPVPAGSNRQGPGEREEIGSSRERPRQATEGPQ